MRFREALSSLFHIEMSRLAHTVACTLCSRVQAWLGRSFRQRTSLRIAPRSQLRRKPVHKRGNAAIRRRTTSGNSSIPHLDASPPAHPRSCHRRIFGLLCHSCWPSRPAPVFESGLGELTHLRAVERSVRVQYPSSDVHDVAERHPLDCNRSLKHLEKSRPPD